MFLFITIIIVDKIKKQNTNSFNQTTQKDLQIFEEMSVRKQTYKYYIYKSNEQEEKRNS